MFYRGLDGQRWSEPRFTQAADATVLTQFVDDERTVDGLLMRKRDVIDG